MTGTFAVMVTILWLLAEVLSLEPLGLLQPGYVGVAQRRPEAVVGQKPCFEIHHRVSGAGDGPFGGPDRDFGP